MEIAGGAGERVVVWPLFIPDAGLDGRRAVSLLKELSARVFPGVTWGEPSPAAASFLRAEGRSAEQTAVIFLHWIVGPRGASAACFYAAAAPKERFRPSEEIFARILGSFTLRGSAGGREEISVAFVPWTDSRERAFSLKVPKGWRVSGGLFRFASVDTRPFVEAGSPDNNIRIFLGDAELPIFALPTRC